MAVAVKQTVAVQQSSVTKSVKKQLRGSSLLLAGRLLSRLINFAAQLMIVRYLSQQDYGAISYALSGVAFFRGISTLGLRRGISRFVPIYHEHGDHNRLFGAIALALATVALTSIIIIGGIHTSPELLSRFVTDKGLPIHLLMILIFLVPVEALDGLLIALFACFANPKAIFFRKHVLGPALKLAVVLLLIVFQADVKFLAYGYLVSSAAGVLIYTMVLFGLLKNEGTLQHFDRRSMQMPVKQIFAFTIPLLTSDLVTIVMHSADTMLLGFFHPSTEVAMYRVVLPAATLNTIVMASFGLLYTPLAARLFAKNDYEGINTLYWRTAVWMAVLSFPVFSLTFSLARPITELLYGERYASSWVILQMMSFSYYLSASLGFNGLTLKVLGKLRYVVIINVVAMLVNIVLDLLLIPKLGALGAAIATALAIIAHNILKQAGLRAATGLNMKEWRYVSFYLILASSALGMFLLQYFTQANVYLMLPIAAGASLAVLVLCKHRLEVEETFPELLKIPVLGPFLRTKRSREDSVIS